MSRVTALRRILEEYRDLNRNPSHNLIITVGLPNEDDIFKWKVCFVGPDDTPYKGGLFLVLIHFPDDYPNHPPQIHFKTPIYHLNVNPKISSQPGGFLLGQPSLTIIQRWRPDYKMRDVLVSIYSLFYMVNPECDFISNGFYGQNEYVNNKSLYEEKIKYFTKKYADYNNYNREYNDSWDFSYNP